MIATFTLFDIRNFTTTTPTRMLFSLLLVLVIGATSPVQGSAILSSGIVVSIFASYFFQADERGRLDVLFALSAVSRTAVVIGRYLATLLLAAVITAAGLAVTFLAAVVQHESLDWPLIAIVLLISYGYVAVTVAVQLPWLFASGFTKGRPVVFVFIIAIVGFGWLAGQTGMFAGLQLELSTGPSPLVVAGVVAAGAAVLATSAAVSRHFYRKREL